MATRRGVWPGQKPGTANKHGQSVRVQTSVTTYYEQDQRGTSGKFLMIRNRCNEISVNQSHGHTLS
ncbi:hypothetical protein PG985_007518 [Apiospora marii]|uniref:uncharacterized protein n=1 Tax=Apiospora marii TaxID=335849 RepID=UPI00312E551E